MPELKPIDHNWLVSGGEMGERVRSMDWSATPLGPCDAWPQCLRTVVNLVLSSSFPMAILWGSDLVFIYNDAFRVIAADKHPHALGRSTREVWPEIWKFNHPIFERVMAQGETIHFEDQRFRIDRHGALEDAWFTLSCSPVHTRNGQIGGALVVLLETTPRVTLEQRQKKANETLAAQIATQKATETALRESEKRYRMLAETMLQGVVVHDATGVIIAMNSAAERILGQSHADFLGSNSVAQEYHTMREDGTPFPGLEHPAMVTLRTGQPIAGVVMGVFNPREQAYRWIKINAVPMFRPGEAQVCEVYAVFEDITERKRADEALKRSFEPIGLLINNLPGYAFFKDANLRYVMLNNRACQLLGRPLEDIVGKDDFELFPAPYAEKISMDDRLVLESGEPLLVDNEEIEEDGQPVILSTRKVPIKDGSGKVTGLIGLSIDITDRKRAEEDLRQSEERLRLASQGAKFGTYTYDFETGVGDWSPELKALWGLEPDCPVELDADKLYKGLHPEDRLAFLAAMTAANDPAGNGVLDLDYRVLVPDGSVRWLHVHGMTEFVGEGKSRRPRWGAGAAIDISERKRAEEALRESEEFGKAILDSVSTNIAVLDHRGVILAVNEAWQRFTRENPNRDHEPPRNCGTGVNYLEVCRQSSGVSAAGAMAAHDGILSVLEGRRPSFTLEYPCHSPDEERWFLMSVTPLGKKRKGVVVSYMNITERMRAEEALRKANVQLLEADRHKDQFLAMLAHELRNPLAPVRNAVQVLRIAGPPDPVLMRQRDIIDRQVAHMARLVDDLLDVSRVTHGKIDLRRQSLDLADVLADAVETTTPLIESRRHTLHVSLPPGGLGIEGDRVRLAQVVGNLLVNAAKYTSEGGQIWLSAEQEDGPAAVVRVRDTGVGIAADLLPRIFDLFTQADQALARSQGGLGIGLTMVRRLVEMHGGMVEARSAGEGRGSEFIVRLPATGHLPAPRIDPGDSQPAEEPTSATGGGTRRILVVDDEVDTVASLAELLELWGHEVQMANDGPSALCAAREFRPDVVLCDIGLPGMDGYEVAQCLRREYPNQPMMLVALTGYAQESDRQEAQEAGFDEHLSKPVDLKVLRERLGQPVAGPG